MKKIIVMCILALCLLLCSCGAKGVIKQENIDTTGRYSMFVEVECTNHWIVVYHIETKVMYVVSDDDYIQGIFTMLVNADGTPMVWGE